MSSSASFKSMNPYRNFSVYIEFQGVLGVILTERQPDINCNYTYQDTDMSYYIYLRPFLVPFIEKLESLGHNVYLYSEKVSRFELEIIVMIIN